MSEIPAKISEKILGHVKSEVLPDQRTLMLKVFVIHLLTAVCTLSVCPQFGISTFQTGINLMHSFMFMGISVCFLLCGVFFMGSTILMASLLLKRDEIRALRYQKTLSTFMLILVSTGFFLVMKPELFIEFSIVWLIGATLGSALTLEVSGRVLSRA